MDNRRPLKIRNQKFIQDGAKRLSQKDITPNQISIASIGFSAFAGLILLVLPYGFLNLWMWALLILFCFLGRGACNIVDGLVAVEGGKSTPSGELFNDVPDRVSDVIILVCAGYACGLPVLGWLAALTAVLVAYVRTLVRGVGAPSDFQGPMAKVHRMIVVAVAVIITPIEAMFLDPGYAIALGLVVVSLGCLWTMWKRVKAGHDYLGNADV